MERRKVASATTLDQLDHSFIFTSLDVAPQDFHHHHNKSQRIAKDNNSKYKDHTG